MRSILIGGCFLALLTVACDGPVSPTQVVGTAEAAAAPAAGTLQQKHATPTSTATATSTATPSPTQTPAPTATATPTPTIDPIGFLILGPAPCLLPPSPGGGSVPVRFMNNGPIMPLDDVTAVFSSVADVVTSQTDLGPLPGMPSHYVVIPWNTVDAPAFVRLHAVISGRSYTSQRCAIGK